MDVSQPKIPMTRTPGSQIPASQIPASRTATSRTSGSQTLARGLEILRAVTAAPDGMAVTEVAEAAGVHRTIAYRALNTLVDTHLLHRGPDGRYRGAAGLLALAPAAYSSLAAAARPQLRDLADRLGAAVSLIVRQGDEAVALAVLGPATGIYHVSFSEGSVHPLNRGAAGLALLAACPEQPGEPTAVAAVRSEGFARTFGEVEPNMHGLAVPLDAAATGVPACLNVISAGGPPDSDAVLLLQAAARTTAERLSRDVPSTSTPN